MDKNQSPVRAMRALAGILFLGGLGVAAAAPVDPAWITLGTVGGPPLHGDQAAISNVLVVGDALYLFDTGNSVLRQLDAAHLPVRNLRGVFITHHHVDHNADLGLVILQAWSFAAHKPVAIVGPPGTVHLVEGLVAANEPTVLAGYAVAGPPNPPLASAANARDLPSAIPDPAVVFDDGIIKVSAISVEHFNLPPVEPLAVHPTAVAYRVDVAGRSFVYSGDTGPTRQLEKLARGADILFSEVADVPSITASLRTLLPGAPAERIDAMGRNMAINHLEPEAVGQVAASAGVHRVVLTHFVPELSAMQDPQGLVRRVHLHFHGPVDLAHDLDRFTASAGR